MSREMRGGCEQQTDCALLEDVSVDVVELVLEPLPHS